MQTIPCRTLTDLERLAAVGVQIAQADPEEAFDAIGHGWRGCLGEACTGSDKGILLLCVRIASSSNRTIYIDGSPIGGQIGSRND
jgi:hypothetical protein